MVIGTIREAKIRGNGVRGDELEAIKDRERERERERERRQITN